MELSAQVGQKTVRHETREITNIKLTMRRQAGYQAAAGAVFDQLLYWENSCSGRTAPSQTMIAAELGLARETVCRVVGWLRRLGYLRTRQRIVTRPDGTRLHGTLVYWLSKDIIQAGILRGKGLMERYRELMRRGQKRSTYQRLVAQGLGATGDVSSRQTYEHLMAAGLGNSRCDLGNATPSRTEFNSDKVGGGDKNWASPALLRLLKEQERRQ